MSKPVKVAIASLVFDYDLYPRHDVNSMHVTVLSDAINAGVTLEPMIVDKTTRRIADGFHRGKAYLRVYGKEAKGWVLFVEFASDADLFLEATRLNAKHGRSLDPLDKTRIALKAQELGIELAVITGAMNITTERFEEYQVRTGQTSEGRVIPLKAGLRHLQGKRLTKKQQIASDKYHGMQLLFYVNQVANALRGDLVDTDNSGLLEGLKELYDLMGSWLGSADRKKRKSA